MRGRTSVVVVVEVAWATMVLDCGHTCCVGCVASLVAVAAVTFVVVGVLVRCGWVIPVVVTGLVVAPKVGLHAKPTNRRDAPLVAAFPVHLVTVAFVVIGADV